MVYGPSSDFKQMRERAIAEYHRELAADESLTAELFAALKADMRARRLAYGGREIGVALRPHILAAAQYDRLTHASELLARAFERMAEALIAKPELLALVGLTEREQSLALVNPGFKSPAVTTRLDAFTHDDEIKFVEYNAENPSSLTDQAGLNQVLASVRAMQTLAARYHLRPLAPAETLLRTLLATYREWGGQGTPHVAIVDWAELPTADEFVLLRDYLAACGVPTIICAPDE